MKKHILIILLIIANACLMTGCKKNTNSNHTTIKNPSGTISDQNEVDLVQEDLEKHNFKLVSSKDNAYTYKCTDDDKVAVVMINCLSGTDHAFVVKDNTIIFKNIKADSVYSISGEFYGNIIIDVTDNYKFELELNGFKQYSYNEVPIEILSGDKIKISAKKETLNYIFDAREKVLETSLSGVIYSEVDLSIQGKGTLFVKSRNNKGIYTKKDLEVKNLNLQVECLFDALRGNDSVCIESGKIILIAKCGDAIKTTKTDISSKGKQRGNVQISGGNILIYAANDGISSAYNTIIDETIASVDLQIFTDKYSKYSDEITDVADAIYYIKYSKPLYSYSLKFFNDENNFVWANSKEYIKNGESYYYPFEKPNGFKYVELYIYNSLQIQGQEQNYVKKFETQAVNDNYDTLSLTFTNNDYKFSWTNYQTKPTNPGFPGGFDGNQDKSDYSTKGIKAGNEIIINDGNLLINSYDDSLHADNGNILENGNESLGNVKITSGNIVLYSNDDAIHADNKVIISGGDITIVNSHEGIEGKIIEISGGNVSVYSKDDGINGTSKTGESIIISGGYLFVYTLGGDGIDSNSKSSFDGILISGGKSVIISLSRANSSIDTEKGYKYTGGNVLAIGLSGGISNESTKSSPSIVEIGKTANLNLAKDSYLSISNSVSIKVPTNINALVIYLGSKDVTISTSQTSEYHFDKNGVFWIIK